MRPSLTAAKWQWSVANLEQTGAASDVEIIAAPGAGKALYIWKIAVAAASGTLTVKVTNGNDALGTRLIHSTIAQTFPDEITFPFEAPFRLTTDTALNLTTNTGNCAVTVFYVVGS